MRTPEAAWEAIEEALAAIPAPAGEAVARTDALHRVLAAPIAATTDLPSADLSALDGFALAGDAGGDGYHRIAGTTLAGGEALERLAAGEAARIMTGATVPGGADRVVGFEDADATDGRVRARREPPIGTAIRRRGEVVRSGAPLLAEGAALSPAALALLASQGIEWVLARPLPRVELLVTGDEVVRGESLRPGEVRDSHTDFLSAELLRAGIRARTGPTVGDRRDELEKRLDTAFAHADVVLTCGGVSMGDADLVPDALTALGCRILFHGVAVQPGKPLLAATRGKSLIFGLPGNPGSVMSSFWLFVRPALARLAGRPAGFWSDARLSTLGGSLGAGRGRDRFVPATVEAVGGKLVARPRSPMGSHDLLAFASAEALLRVRPGDAARREGDEVELLEI
jgi:molybdopterin molybdotransferase